MLKVCIRFLTSAKKSVNTLSIISLIALSLGVCAMLVTLSVMAGFEEEMKGRLFRNSSQLIFKQPSEALVEKLKKDPRVKALDQRLVGEVLVTYADKMVGAYLWGIDQATPSISDALSTDLALYSIDSTPTTVGVEGLQPDPGLFGAGSKKYQIPIEQIQNQGRSASEPILILPLKYAKRILNFSENLNELEVETVDLDSALEIANENEEFKPYTWLEREASLFYSLKLERAAMGILLSFIVLVASFTIVSSIGMTAMEKIRELAVLRCLGLSKKGVEKLLRQAGLILGFLGIFIGIVLGLLICVILKTTEIIPLPDVYVDRTLPVLIKTSYVVGVAAIGGILVFIASLVPSKVATKQNILEIIRNSR